MAKSNGNSPKSYSKFTEEDISMLGLRVVIQALFPGVAAVQPSEWLLESLDNPPEILLGSEKAKSENLISPILKEMVKRNRRKVVVYSGYEFNVDEHRGLSGRCDFIFSRSAVPTRTIQAPAFFVVEAKNESLEAGFPQCVAEMYAAWEFNERQGNPLPAIYGAITFGREWQFCRLEKDVIYQDDKIWQVSALPYLLGVLQRVFDAV